MISNCLDKKSKKNKKQGKNKELPSAAVEEKSPVQLLEETIPAYVTIKRDSKDDTLPTVTITLKGSTPDQDKLLYKIVNGYSQANTENLKQGKKKNKNQVQSTGKVIETIADTEKSCKKKNKNGITQEISKELKVTLTIPSDSSDSNVNRKTKQTEEKKKTAVKNNSSSVKATVTPSAKKAANKQTKPNPTTNNNKDIDLNIPMLRLPPGKLKPFSVSYVYF